MVFFAECFSSIWLSFMFLPLLVLKGIDFATEHIFGYSVLLKGALANGGIRCILVLGFLLCFL